MSRKLIITIKANDKLTETEDRLLKALEVGIKHSNVAMLSKLSFEAC